MGLESKLRRWQDAGLLDGATADRIRAYESASSRPVALWAVIGLGLLALALGIILIIASQWDEIPAATKLWAHWLATAAVAIAAWLGIRREQRWQAEAALFLLGALVLGGIALQGQIYQLVSPIWQPLLFWAALCTPAFLLLGRTRLTAIALALMLVWLGVTAATEVSGWAEPLARGLAFSLPPTFVALSFVHHDDAFGAGLREAGLILLLLGASLAHIAWADRLSADSARDMALSLPLPAAATIAGVLLARRADLAERRTIPLVLLASFAGAALAMVSPHENHWTARLVGALSFFAMWGGIGLAAYAGGWRTLFGVAVAAIALRLFIVYFELFGTLASTGWGLVLAGLLVIGLGVAWRRIIRLFLARRAAA